ncbi:MAG: hypothetical protein GF404_07415 [candidate division Zixibacteria bacterium]|nr:hypothetical protein [candidate division Zixibacteria bacterium]
MGLRYKNQNDFNCFFATTTFQDWKEYGNVPGMYEALAGSLAFCLEKYEANLIGYVFMPNHIHLLLVIDGSELSSFMRDYKKYIAQKAKTDLGIKEKKIWMPRYDRVVIVDKNLILTKLNYIHNNPVKAKLVSDQQKWKWSSAGDYFSDSESQLKISKDWQ